MYTLVILNPRKKVVNSDLFELSVFYDRSPPVDRQLLSGASNNTVAYSKISLLLSPTVSILRLCVRCLSRRIGPLFHRLTSTIRGAVYINTQQLYVISYQDSMLVRFVFYLFDAPLLIVLIS